MSTSWRRYVPRMLKALGLAAVLLIVVLGLCSAAIEAASPRAGSAAAQQDETASIQQGPAPAQDEALHWLQDITTTTSSLVVTSTGTVAPAASGPLILLKSVATGTENPDVAYNGERITYTLTIANASSGAVTLTGPISLTDEIPRSAGQVQLDQIACSDDCLLGIATQIVTSPLGESIVVTTVESVAWEIAAAKGQTLTLSAGDMITRSFSGRVTGQPDGTIIANSALIFYEADGVLGFASTPEDTRTTVRVRPSLAGTTSLSDAPTWLSRDAGGTLSIDWGDFDRDGDLDLALGSTSGTSVYRNEGGRLALFWEVPLYTLGVRWADLDGAIGNLELVAVGQSDGNSAVTPGTNYVYHLNAGDTGFDLLSTFTSEVQLLRVAANDFTNDGQVDLVASTNAIDADCPVRLFTNPGGGSFAGPGTCVSDEPTANIAAGDFDNDDDADLVMGAFPNRTWLYRNNGTSNPFTTAPIEVDASATFLPYDFAWGDYDRDGYLDLAAAFPIDRKVRVYRNQAGTGFSPGAEFEFRTSLFYTPLTVEWGDLDGNGYLDLIVADSPPVVYLNRGWADPGFSSTRFIRLSPLAEGGQVWSVRAADQDNDGDLDLAFANRDGASLLMTSFSGFLDTALFPIGPIRAANSVAWADMDDNGYLDLLLGAGPTVLRTALYHNNGGIFAATPIQTYDLGPGAAVAVGTVNGNSSLDLAVGSLAGLQLYLDGNLGAPPWTPSSSTDIDALTWADAEHDGDLDLLVARDGALFLYVNAGGQLPSTPLQIASAVGAIRSIAWGDHDGDGYLDIAVGNYGQADRIYHNDGGNAFHLAQSLGPVDGKSTSVAWADYDGDSDQDLAVGNDGQPNRIYQNQAGTLAPSAVWASTESSKTTSIAWGDWDNDGDLDLAVGNDGQRDQVYVNQGSTPQSAQFVWVWSSDETYATTGVAWGDADRDGDLDLAISQGGSGRNGIYVNNHVVPSHLADLFVPTMPLPDNPSYVSIDRPGTVPDAYLYSSAELLSGDQVPIPFRVHDPDGTRVGIGSNEEGDPLHSVQYEYSLDGGGTWHPATQYIGPLPPPVMYPQPTTRLGMGYTYVWNPEADGAVSDNARFRVTIVPLKEAGPVRRGAAAAVSPPFRVRATTCIWPVDPAIAVVPSHPEPGDLVELIGGVSAGSGVLTYTWDLGDGQVATGQKVEHRFAGDGTYQVEMTVTSEPCPIPGVVTARQRVVVGTGVPNIYLPLVLKSYSASSAALNSAPGAAPTGTSYWDAVREADQADATAAPTRAEEASLPTYYLGSALRPLESASVPVLQATALSAAYPEDIVTVSSCITSCTVLSITRDARGIHTQPSISDEGDRVAFWSTGNLGGIRARFDYDIPVVLLVDDDDNSPNVRPHYETALDALGVPYDVWDTRTSNSYEPTLDVLARYRTIIWFSGDEWTHGAAGPGPAAEGALAAYLNGGDERCLFITSQDYHYNRGLTPFMQSYLGVSAVQGDVGTTAVTGAGFFTGLGAYALSYPGSNYADWIHPLPAPTYLGFTGNRSPYRTDLPPTGPAAVYRDVGAYRTTFWGYPFEAIAGAESRVSAMDAVLDFCNTRRYVPTLVINEVDLAASVVELYNFGAAPVDTTDISIEAGNDWATLAKFLALGDIPPGAYATVPLGLDWATAGGGSVTLYQAVDRGIDFVRWGTSSTQPRPGTYWLGSNPLKPADPDNTLGRGDDTNSGSDWCEQEPTLGRKNTGCGAGFNNPDGNIETYWSEIGVAGDITHTQVSSSSGSILGGFNLWPSVSGSGEGIALFSDRDLAGRNGDANFEIFLYHITDGTFLQVTESRECVNLYPVVSADGSRVVFASDCDLVEGGNTDENQEIYLAVIGPSGTVSLTQLTETQDIVNDQPAVSADGRRVAFVGDANVSGEVIVYEISGTVPSLLRSFGGGLGAQPSLNEDGTHVAFAMRAAGDNQEIYWAEVDASPGVSVTQITSTTLGTTVDQPSLSGDGLRVAYVCDSGPEAGIWLHDIADRVRTRVAAVGDSNSRPFASGNGLFVAYSSDRQIYRAEFPLVDLSILKSSAPAIFTPGRAVTYTITVMNDGPSAAVGAIVSDTIPSELSSLSWTCAGDAGATCSLPDGHVLYHPVTLPAGSRVVYTVVGILDPSTIDDVVNVAEVIPPPLVPDHTIGNNVTPPDIKTPVPEADVSIVKTADPDPVPAGATLTYTLSYANLQPSDARYVYITDVLPVGVTFGGGVVPPSYFVLEAAGPTLRWYADTLPASATGDIVFTVTVQSSMTGTLTNTAVITSSVFDPTPENNRSVITTTVTTEADLEVVKTHDPAAPNAGETLTYTLTYTNHGPSDALGAAITDWLPISVTWSGLASATPPLDGPTMTGPALVWTTPRITAGASGQIEVTVVVTDAFDIPGVVVNQALIASGTTDPVPGNNSETLTTTVTVQADLSVSKASEPPTFVPGNEITYTIAVVNAGSVRVPGATVYDPLPDVFRSGRLSWTCVASASSSCGTPATGTGDINAAVDLAAGGSITYVVVGTLSPSIKNQLDSVVNTVWVTAPAGYSDPDPDNNHATTTDLLSPQVDLQVSKSDSGAAVAGTVLTYTVTYTNAGGPSDASDLLITDQLPTGVTYGGLVSASPPVVESGPSGGSVSWALDVLPVDASGTIVFTVVVNADLAESTITNQVGITSAEEEQVPGDNQYALVTPITSEADLWVQKAGTPDPATAGGVLTYTLTYGNDGPSVAQNTWLSDTVPTSASIVSVDPPTSTQAGQTLRWALDALATGAPGEITIVVAVDSAATGSVTNRAAVGADTSDSDQGNNTAETVTAVESQVNLALSKAAPGAVNPGGVLTYTLTYTNVDGPSAAHSVVVTDQLSAGVAFGGMIAGPTPSQSGQLLSWTVGSLAVGAPGTLEFTATVGSAVANGTVLTNRAGISSSDIEVDSIDNVAQAVTTVTTATLAAGADSTWVRLAQEADPAPIGQSTDTPRFPLGEQVSLLYLALGSVSAIGFGATWTRRWQR